VKHPRTLAACALITAAAAAGCSSGVPAPAAARGPFAAIPAAPGSLNGVYENGAPASYAGITRFAAATGTTPHVALYYSSWWEKFQSGFAETARGRGAVVLVQINPQNVNIQHIAAGWNDTYLRSYAASVKAFGHPVILSFGHEMNGRWYSWGNGHTKPAVFIAAWRHIVDVFRQEGAGNVTWLWTVNALNAAGAPLRQWWPGASYVTWVGIDGYYYTSSDTYQDVFGRTITEVRAFTSDPVLISEVATGPGTAAASQVTGLFAGMRADKVLGAIWFDEAQDKGEYHQDWNLEADPAALAAYKAAVKTP
jgi:hypothetical protein